MSNKSVVLFYPRPTQGYLKERRRDIYVVRRLYAPLSVMYLAATLEEAGFSVSLFDYRLNTIDEILNKIADLNDILFFGISTMTGSQIKSGLEIAQRLRSIYGNDVPLVWGGVHPTILPEKTIIHPLVDIIGYGEADYSIIELARAIAEGKPLSNVKGIYFQHDGAIIKTPPQDNVKLDYLPIPSWEHIKDYLNYAQYPILATILTSRGCPYNCAYCYKWGVRSGQTWKPVSVDRIMREVDYLNGNFGFDIFEIADENFILDPIRALELIRNFKDRKFKISAIRSNFLTFKDNVVDELRDFCDYVAYSPETGSSRIQVFLNKRADYKKMKRLNAKLYDMSIGTVHTFIFGFPFETEEDIKATVDLCREFKVINPASRMAIYQYMPYPKTPLADMMVSKYGLEYPDNFEEWSKTDMYGELDLKFRPWVNQDQLRFMNNFQLLFNLIFNTYDVLGKEAYDIYNSDSKIQELMGDISTIPRASAPMHTYVLNERITPELIEKYKENIFI